MKVNCLPSARQIPKNKLQKILLQEIRESLLKLDWPKHPILFSRLRELIGCQQQTMMILRECIDKNSRKSFLINYLYVLDYMLTIQSYNMMLHKYLVQLYCDLFKHLLWQTDYEGLEKMKTMRKYWVGKISFNLYANIHQAIIRYFNINIDCIQQQSLHDLKKFYLEHLRMNYNDLYFHLPQLKTNTIDYQPTNKKPIYQSIPNSQKNKEDGSTTELQSSKQEKEGDKPKKDKVDQARNVKLEQVKVQAAEKVVPQVELLKRKREQSEETTITVRTTKRFRYDSQHIGQFTHQLTNTTLNKQTNKHCIQQVKDAPVQRGPLKGFNFLLSYNCAQCPMKFKQPSELQAHNSKGCNSLNGEEKLNARKNTVVLKQEEVCNFSRTCKICYKQLEAEYENGNWIVLDSVKLSIYEVATIIHLDCQKQVTPQMTKIYQSQQQQSQ